MKYIIKTVSFLLILTFSFTIIPCYGISLDTLGINVPNIQQVSQTSASNKSVEIAMEAPIDEASYKLGPGDLLSINIIVGNAELTINHQLIIGADGKIFFPNIGEIYLAGLNLKEAKNVIRSEIDKVYMEKFSLSLLLSQPKKVKIYLSGMVKNPGPMSVFDNSRVSEVIEQAGGIISGASNRYIYIKRNENGEEKLLKADLFEAYRSKDLSKDIRIRSGDVIEVPSADDIRVSQISADQQNEKLLFEGKETFVYVYGEVTRSGRYEYVPGKKLSDYLSYAGGPTSKALLNSVTITRNANGKSEKFNINASDIIYNGKYSSDIEIIGGDVINVPGNFFYVADFTSFVNTVLLALTLYSTVRIIK